MLLGFLEKEIRKDGIPMLDTGENPDAPAPREMIDLEVSSLIHFVVSILRTTYSSLFRQSDISASLPR